MPVVLYRCETWSIKLTEKRGLRVLDNMILRKTFGPKKDEMSEEWKRLHNEELYDVYSSPGITRVIKSRKMRWAVYVERMGREDTNTGLWYINLRERDLLENPGVNGRLILKWIVRKWDGHMAQNRDGRRSIVNVVNNFSVPENVGNFLTS